MFEYRHRVQFYETDLMGIVHHSNYLRFFEEARLDWLRKSSLIEEHLPNTDLVAAVLETRLRHRRPCFLGEELRIFFELKRDRSKLHFQYALFGERFEEACVLGQTLHILVDGEMKVTRMPERWSKLLEKECWTKDWFETKLTMRCLETETVHPR